MPACAKKCEDRHCSLCVAHLEPHELKTCPACVGHVRADLVAILDLAALLPEQATQGSENALALMSRGSEGLAEDDETNVGSDFQPPSWVLAWWADRFREARGLDARRTPWRHRPALVLTRAYRTLDEHHTWAAQHHPGWKTYARDLRRTRGLLESVLHAESWGDEGIPCWKCETPLRRDYRDPKPCQCGPRPLAHARHTRDGEYTVCCLLCVWEERHQACDQGGLLDPRFGMGWTCPKCGEYTVGQYDRAVRASWGEHAPYLPAVDLAAELGVQPSTIWQWARRGHIQRRGRDEQRRTLYDANQARRHADQMKQNLAQ